MSYLKKKIYLLFDSLRTISLIMVLTFIGLAIADIYPRGLFIGELSVYEEPSSEPISANTNADFFPKKPPINVNELLKFTSSRETTYASVSEIMACKSSERKNYIDIVLANGDEISAKSSLVKMWEYISVSNYEKDFIKTKSTIINYGFLEKIIDDCDAPPYKECIEVVFDNNFSMYINSIEHDSVEDEIDKLIIK